MLKITKSITLNGTSTIPVDEKSIEIPVVSMNANISENGNSNINTVIINKELYESNKSTCRADIDAFTAYVREIEDSQPVG